MDNYYEEILDRFKKSEEKRKTAFRKNLPSYIWLVIKDLIALGIIIGIFSFASNFFETITFSLLILIYLSVEGFFSSYGYKTMQMTLALVNEMLQIKKLLKYQETEEEKEKLEKAAEMFNKLEAHVHIHSIFLFIFFLIALWNLLFFIL